MNRNESKRWSCAPCSAEANPGMSLVVWLGVWKQAKKQMLTEPGIRFGLVIYDKIRCETAAYRDNRELDLTRGFLLATSCKKTTVLTDT